MDFDSQLAEWLETCRNGYRRDVIDDLVNSQTTPETKLYLLAKLLDMMGSEEQTNFRRHLERIITG